MTPAERDNRLRMQERDTVRHSATEYGMDTVEVVHSPGVYRLRVRFVPPAPGVARSAIPTDLSADQIRFRGAHGAPHLRVQGLKQEPRESGLLVDVEVPTGERVEGVVYTLQIDGRSDFGARHRTAEFCFGSRLLTGPPPVAAPARSTAAPVDLMNKDYASFRRLMLEHLAAQVPDWTERHPADLGVVIVEVLAYVADMLSYYQDAAAAEAFLDTARLRASVVRHARLLGYRVQPVVSTRSWVHLDVDADQYTLPAGTLLLTQQPHWTVIVGTDALNQAMDTTSPVFFETVSQETLYVEHNLISPCDFGIASFALEQGATSAWFEGALHHLRPGSVLAFEAIPDPVASDNAQSSPASWFAQVVRLSHAPVITQHAEGPRTYVRWFAEDALKQAFPLSSDGVTTWVRGNMVLIDAGRTLPDQTLPPVLNAARYRPPAAQDIVWAVPYDAALECSQAACKTLTPDPRTARAAVKVREENTSLVWTAVDSLLEEDRFARSFVVETGEKRMGTLRFGDGQTGRRPDPQTSLTMSVRVWSPEHVGSVAIAHIVGEGLPILAVHNPLSIEVSGVEESLERIRVLAPSFALDPQLAVLPDDFVMLVKRHPAVTDAVAEEQESGLARRMTIWLQLVPGVRLTANLRAEIMNMLQPGLLLGRSVQLHPASRLAVQVWAQVRISGAHARISAEQALARADAAVREFFAEGRFGFGDPAVRSQLTADLMLVPSVIDVQFERFCTAGSTDANLVQDVLRPGSREILQLPSEMALPGSLKLVPMEGSL